jgi:hypothetical protein
MLSTLKYCRKKVATMFKVMLFMTKLAVFVAGKWRQSPKIAIVVLILGYRW